jgi:hypothetical protein
VSRRVAFALVLAPLAIAGIAHAQAPLEPLPPPPPTSEPKWTPPPPLEDGGAPLGPGDLGAPPPAMTQDLGPPPAPREPREEAARLRPSYKAELGYQYAQVHGVPINAGRLSLFFGGQNDSQTHYGFATVMVGETREHRRTWDLRAGYSGDFLRAGILRAGLYAQMGYLVVRRVTLDSRAYAVGVGAGVHAGIDVITFGGETICSKTKSNECVKVAEHALTLDARFDGNIHFGNAFQWGPSVLLGFRW